MSYLPDAGWYPNPEGGDALRWWTGSGWTDHLSTQQAPRTAANASPSPHATATTAGPIGTGPTLATFGQRLAATIIDGLVLFAALLPFLFVLGITFINSVDPAIFEPGATPEQFEQLELPAGVILLTLVFYALTLGLPILYGAMFEGGAYGQTIGKWAVNISVRNPDGSAPIGRSRSFGRALMRAVSATAFYLGFLWMLWDPQKRTWHDMATDVRVVVVSQRVPFGALLRSSVRGNKP